MTLIINQYFRDGIVCAADSLITIIDPKTEKVIKYDNYEKITFFKKINASVSFFGQANINGQKLMDFVKDFHSETKPSTIGEFSYKLKDKLNSLLDHIHYFMGFHISGYEERRNVQVPVFYSVKNNDFRDEQYHWLPNSAFRAVEEISCVYLKGYNESKINLYFQEGKTLELRNGDIPLYCTIYNMVDEILKRMSDFPEFPRLENLEDYRDRVLVHLGVISMLHKLFSNTPRIGHEINVITIPNEGCVKQKTFKVMEEKLEDVKNLIIQ